MDSKQNHSSTQSSNSSQTKSRRGVLKTVLGGGVAAGAALSVPSRWSKPVVDAVMLPVHARSSAEPVDETPTVPGSFTAEHFVGDNRENPSLLNGIIPSAYADFVPELCEVFAVCIRLNTNGTVTIFSRLHTDPNDGGELCCVSGTGSVGSTITLSPEPGDFCNEPGVFNANCDSTVKVDSLVGEAPNRTLTVDGVPCDEIDLEDCDCNAVAP